jgi:hypothetical protein
MKDIYKLLLGVIIVCLLVYTPFVVLFKNTKFQSHCNNKIPTGKIINIEKIDNTTIIELENKGDIKKLVIDNYYFEKYNVNDSIKHCN